MVAQKAVMKNNMCHYLIGVKAVSRTLRSYMQMFHVPDTTKDDTPCVTPLLSSLDVHHVDQHGSLDHIYRPVDVLYSSRDKKSAIKEIAGEMNSTSKELYIVERKSSMGNTTSHEHSVNLSGTSCSLQNLFENRADYLEFGVPLYEASLNGNWETAKLILDKRPELVRFCISRQLGTALHVAAMTEETKMTLQFVKNLVNMMTREELELPNQFSNTAFWIASATGNVNMAMVMMEKNPSLLYIRGANSLLPLAKSASGGKYKIVKYLYDVSQKMIDIALQIVNDLPELAATVSVLKVLARKPEFATFEKNIVMRIIDPVISPVLRFLRMKVQSAAKEDTDALKLLKIIWRRVCETMYIDEIEVMMKGPPRILFVAAERGNTRFIVECLRTYPDLMFDKNDDGLTIFHIAVLHRRQGVYNLMYEIGSANLDICLTTDKMHNNMLHLAGKSSKEMTAKMAKASLLQTLNTKRYWWDKTLLVTTKGRKRLLAYTRRRGTRVGSAKGNPFVFAVNATQEKRRDTHRLEKGRVGKAL
ncbi:ankyrin repeat-containing protein [Tanacetum coccineum]